MRIIAGTRKGTVIAAPRGAGTRPTADKVRGAIFNMLGDVAGSSVLDLFAGSGALGLEALSRGAREALFVDSRPEAARTIAANISKLRIDNARLVRRDYRAILKSAAKKGERFDLIFVDPPYKMLRVVVPELEKWLPSVVAAGGIVVVESDARGQVSLPMELAGEKRYGDTRVCFYKPPAGDPA